MEMKEKILKLLGTGVSQEVCATALGVTPGYVSQLMGQQDFAAAVAELRFKNLTDINDRDKKYDTLEDKLLDKLEDILTFIVKPREVLSALVAVNNAKRRGQTAPEQVHIHAAIVNLQLPQIVRDKFIVDGQNQIVQVGDTELITMSSKNFAEVASKKLLDKKLETMIPLPLIESSRNEDERSRTFAEEDTREKRATAT